MDQNNSNSSTNCPLHEKKCGEYKACALHDDKCGSYNRVNIPITGVFETRNLNADTTSHFKSLLKIKISKTVTERELIENRLNRELAEDEKLCAYHRNILGIGFKPKTTCQHPRHEKQVKQKKSATVRVASMAMVDHVTNEYAVHFPIGSVLCSTHNNKTQEIAVEVINEPRQEPDPEFVPNEIVVSEDVIVEAEETAAELALCLQQSPVTTLKRKKLEDLDERAVDKYRRKYKKMKKSLKDVFTKAAAPGQLQKFKKAMEFEFVTSGYPMDR